MKQLLQSLGSGEITLASTPQAPVRPGHLRIVTTRSLISAGTEKMLLSFGKGNLLSKARQQPQKVKEVLQKARADGIAATLEAVQSKLDEPIPLGYCNVGVVTELGGAVSDFQVGDRVASNGPHAEAVVVPENLCAPVPEGVPDDAAAFTVIGAVALQGVRLAMPTLGERFVVIGLGLVGLLTVQILKAHGCSVLGLDPDQARVGLARSFGAEAEQLNANLDPVQLANTYSRGRGVDGVILTLSSRSDEPVSQAAQMCRKRGRIVLVGVTGLKLNRADFYEKELTFQVSSSYGPGRYDPAYEQKGLDYPIGFVRWTAQRNFEAVLELMAAGKLNVEPLITHRYAFEEAPKAYDMLSSGSEPYLGILLEYSGSNIGSSTTITLPEQPTKAEATNRTSTSTGGGPAHLGVIGAGNYSGRVLIPAFKKTDSVMQTLANSGGVSGVHQGTKHGFKQLTTDTSAIFGDPNIDAVVIATRHDSHANYVMRALESGKSVFCEKPLALTIDELDKIEETYAQATEQNPVLMVGFNRRFAPLMRTMHEMLSTQHTPKSFIITVNAGAIPVDHWTQDPAVGGGRLIGEACHFIDLMRYLAGAKIKTWDVRAIAYLGGSTEPRDDKAAITLTFEDGSFGVIHYLANGNRAFPKERVEVFAGGRILQLNNFRSLTGYGWPDFKTRRSWRQDKGQSNCTRAFVDAITHGGPPPIPIQELFEVSRVTIEVGNAARH